MTDKADSGKMMEAPMGMDPRVQQAPDPGQEQEQEQSGHDYLEGFLVNGPESADGPESVDGPESADGAAAKADQPDKSEDGLEARVVEALRAIYDPEIPVNIYDLGLIYGIEADADAHVIVTMTLTTPNCPVAEIMPAEVEQKTRAVEGVSGATVNLVWDPPWDPSRMSEEAQLELGFI